MVNPRANAGLVGKRLVVAFYTLGDTTVVRELGCRRNPAERTQSYMYQQYAQQVGGPAAWILGVDSVSVALARLQGMASETVERLLFVGHGTNAQGGCFFFLVPGTPQREFDAADQELMAEIGDVLIPNIGSVEFHACRLVDTDFISTLQRTLANSCAGNIYAYRHRMFMRPQVSEGCNITGWSNRTAGGAGTVRGGPGVVTPASFTTYPFGRAPGNAH